MSSQQNTSDPFKESVKRAVRAALSLGYTVRHNPYSATAKWHALKSKKPASVPTWFVDPGNMASKVVAELPNMPKGTVKQLMASTGAGKTTKLPVHIAKEMRTSMLVLVPTISIAEHVCKYVQEHVAPPLGMGGNVFEFTSSMSGTVVSAPAVYYCAAGEFLAHLCAEPKLLRNLSVQLILVDESHVIRPEYQILNRLIAADVFDSVKLLFVSATVSAASDVSKENSDKRVSVQIPNDVDMDAAPEAHQANSPMHHRNINSRTLVFLCDDREFSSWLDYYTKYDIPAMAYGYEDRISAMSNISKFLDGNRVCVVLTTSLLETSYTFPFDVVIDSGRTLVPRWNFTTGKYEAQRERVTKSQAIQRAARVGRIFNGVAHSKKADQGVGVNPVDYEITQYVYLWSRMFNMTIMDPSVSEFERFFGSVSLECIGMLLTCALPPVVAVPYIADDGLYKSWKLPFGVLMAARGSLVISNTQEDRDTSKWRENVMPSMDPEEPGLVTYRSMLELTYPYDVLVCYIWLVRQGDADVASDAMTMYGGSVRRNQTKRSTRPPVPKIPDVFRRGGTQHTVAGTVYNPRSKKPVTQPVVTVDRQLSETETAVTEVPFVKQVVMPTGLTEKNVSEIPYMPSKRVESWASGSSSSDVSLNDLRVVSSPKKYWRSLMYPYNNDLMGSFNAHKAANNTDYRRFEQLMTGAKKFGALHTESSMLKDKQDEYMLSVLRVHRVSVIDMLQSVVAEGTSKPSVFERLFKDGKTTTEIYAQRAQEAAGQLEMMLIVGYKFAVERKHKHSGHGTITDMMYLYKQAEYALDNGDKAVHELIKTLKFFTAPFIVRRSLDNRVTAQAWNMNNRQFTPLHVYEEVGERAQKAWLVDAGEQIDIDDDVAVFHATSPAYKYRDPVDKEYVYMVRYDNIKSEIRAYGFSVTHVGTPGLAYVACTLSKGYSGSLVIGARDGCVVGMYVGDTYVSDETVYSGYVSSSAIFGNEIV